MILWGKISQFSAFMILQLIASYQKTGLLEIEDHEERAVIYLTDGNVDAVSIPRSDHLLGSRIVNSGHVPAAELRKIILSEAMREEEEREYLGLTLIRSGLIDEETMMSVLTRQAYENTLELSNWVEGTFRFLTPRKPVVFPVSPRINVQHLLLEVSRLLDEGQRPTRTKTVMPAEELCATCTANCSQRQKDKYLKDGICLWRNMPTLVRESIAPSGERPDWMDAEEEQHNIRDLPFL